MGSTLWCSWLIEELAQTKPTTPNTQASHCRKLFFAGDTGYRSVPPSINTISDLEREPNLPRCPEFAGIGDLFGPIDLALLPIGLCLPRHFMSPVHCAPEDSVDIHIDIKSKRSIGMHWGTVRGGISAHYEDVREPPRRWREAAEKRGLVWGKDVGLLDIGETVVV
jgi:N-acyl-phosphatidylethanolamine-hydrolysing phospholipase D